MKKDKYLKAKNFWNEGNYLLAGKELFESIDDNKRSIWAMSLLQIINKIHKNDEFEELIKLIDHKNQWKQAEISFGKIRNMRLVAQVPLEISALDLAENIAKVIYNMSNYSPKYDKNSGWKIGGNIASVISNITDNDELVNELLKSYWTI